MHPTNPPPAPPTQAASLDDSVRQTQINAADHKRVVQAAEGDQVTK
jgi:hypothetical protein